MKAREFWILKELNSNRALTRQDGEKWDDDVDGKPAPQWSHVIEYAEVERLRSALSVANGALETLASSHKPRHDKEEYWNAIPYEVRSTVLATDTKIAREALTKLNEILGEGE
jgi:hypothetical protein